MRIRVVGIGTSAGDDAAGPLVATHLAAGPALPKGVEAVACDRPFELIELMNGCDGAVLVDATRSGRPAGTVHEPDPHTLREARPVSSHGIGVPEALALARALGRVPDRLALVGIEAQSATGDALSPAVRAALAEAGTRVRAICAAWLAGRATETTRRSPHA